MTARPFFLDQINPLRGLDERGLITLQELAMRGYYSRLMWTYYFFEKKDPTVRAVKRRLLAALADLDWSIKQPDIDETEAEKKAMSDKQAETLRKEYDAISNLRAALTFLALAELRGFSHCNKVYAGAIDPKTGAPFNAELDPWTVVELRIVEQWFWARNGFYGEWLYNQDAREINIGDPIRDDDYVIHEVEDPADEIFAQFALKRRVNDADWDGFLEDYGVPAQFFSMPPNVPRDKEAEYQRLAELALSRARGAVPHGTELLTPSATGSGGAGVFAERLRYLDEQIVIAGTSGKLTVLTQSGAGTLAGGAQKEAFDEIAQAIANQVSTVLHKQFDEPVLERLHAGEPVLAYFEFAHVDKEDTSKILTDAKTAADAGYKMDESELSERAGMQLTFVGVQKAGSTAPQANQKQEGSAAAPATTAAAPSPAVAPQSPLASVAPDPEQLRTLFSTAVTQLAEAEAADLVPLRRALETAQTDPTPEKMQALLDQLSTIQGQLGTRSEEVRANILGTSLATGLSS